MKRLRRQELSRDAAKTPTSRVLEGERAGVDRARERDLAETARGGDLVAAEEDAVATVDRRPVAPAGAGKVQGAAAAVHHLTAAPSDALAPVLEGYVEQLLQAPAGVIGAFV